MTTLIRQKLEKGVHQIVATAFLTLVATIPLDAVSDELIEAKRCVSDLQDVAEADKGFALRAVKNLLGKISDGDDSVIAAAKTWLGVRSAGDVAILKTVFKEVIAFENVLEFRCVYGHDEETLAAVAPDKTDFAIYLYPDYFKVPPDLKGDSVPSRAGVIFHEIMHMIVRANGSPVSADVYDVGAILNLAIIDPKMAQQNATNWEYFLYEVSVDQ